MRNNFKKYLKFLLLFFASFLFGILLRNLTIHPIQIYTFSGNYATTRPFTPTFTPTPVITTKILLAGDVMLGRKVMIQSQKLKDPLYPFRKVSDKLRNADIVFINLENPIIKDCPIVESGFKFCASPEMVEGLVYSGVDVVSLANNHSGNYGQKGLDETIDILERRGILVTGIGELAIKEVNGVSFGFLGFGKSQQIEPKLEDSEVELIKDSDSKVNVLIIGMHWGTEYQDKALPGVRRMAYELVDNGADVVVGHHPHWVQDVECLKVHPSGVATIPPDGWNRFAPGGNNCPSGSKPVYYSLGNFIFDQMWSEETKKGIIVELTFEGNRLTDQQIYKTYIKNWGQVEFVNE